MYPGRFYVLYPAVGVGGALILRALADDASTEPAFLFGTSISIAVGLGFGGWVAAIGDRRRTDGRKHPEGWGGALLTGWLLGMMIGHRVGESDVFLWCFAVVLVSASAGFIVTAMFRLLRGDFTTSGTA